MTRVAPLAALVSLALTLTITGCRDDLDEAGELGAGKFRYRCSDISDAQCDLFDDVAPEAFQFLVVDGSFGVSYSSFPARAGDFTIQSMSPRLEVGDRTGFGEDAWQQVWVRQPGYLPLVPYATENFNDPDNLLHARAFDMAGILVARRSVGGAFEGSVGGTTVTAEADLLTLRAAPINADGDLLAGALDCDWSSTDPDVVAVSGSRTDNIVRLTRGEAGTATVTVALGAFTADTTIVVEDTP